jgi:predicted nucleic acid-binding protein
MFGLDVSVAASWCFPDEFHPHAAAAYQRIAKEGAVTPAVFWFELRNVLLMGERRKRVTEAHTTRFLKLVSELNIAVDRGPDESRLLSLARVHKLSVYDAAYLELAKREGIDLATLDGQLIRAARAEKVTIVGAN